jgi:hypothetical protein
MSEPADSWRPMRHSDFQEWADINLGDTRQVYARDRRLPADARLVHMPDGEAERFHEDARAGHLICPVPGCPAPELTTRHSDTKRDHFAHLPGARVSGHANYEEIVVGELLRHWVADQAPDVELVEHETKPASPVTILTRLESGDEVALCYVTKNLGVDAWIQHRVKLEQEGIASAWIFAPTEKYLSPPEPDSVPPSESECGEFASFLICDIALFKMMRRCGCWPLLIHTERQELGNLLVPGYKTATRLGLQSAYTEGVLHAVVSSLDNCRICEDGIECEPVVYAGSLETIRQNGQETLRSEYRKRGEHHSGRPGKRRSSGRYKRERRTGFSSAPVETDEPQPEVQSQAAPQPTPPEAEISPPGAVSGGPSAISPPAPSQAPARTQRTPVPRVPPANVPEWHPVESAGIGLPKRKSRHTVGLLLGIAVVAVVLLLTLRTHGSSQNHNGQRLLPHEERSFLANVNKVYSDDCSPRASQNRFEEFGVTCVTPLPANGTLEIRYVKFPSGAAGLENDFRRALPSGGLATGCPLLGATGWTRSDTEDRGLVACNAHTILWCDTHARLDGLLEMAPGSIEPSRRRMIELWRTALNAPSHSRHGIPAADSRVNTC